MPWDLGMGLGLNIFNYLKVKAVWGLASASGSSFVAAASIAALAVKEALANQQHEDR